MSFSQDVIVASDGTIIALKHIESFKPLNYVSEDAVIDRLKGDISFSFRTISGFEHTSSSNLICERQMHYSAEKVKSLTYDERFHVVSDIVGHWMFLLRSEK